MRHVKPFFDKINESAPIPEVEHAFYDTPEYIKANKEVGAITERLEREFFEWCENNGHEGAEGDTDYDMTLDNILNSLIERY